MLPPPFFCMYVCVHVCGGLLVPVEARGWHKEIFFKWLLSFTLKKKVLKISFYVCRCYVCESWVCLVSLKTRRGHEIPWNLCYRQMLVSLCVGAWNLAQEEQQPVLSVSHWAIPLSPLPYFQMRISYWTWTVLTQTAGSHSPWISDSGYRYARPHLLFCGC